MLLALSTCDGSQTPPSDSSAPPSTQLQNPVTAPVSQAPAAVPSSQTVHAHNMLPISTAPVVEPSSSTPLQRPAAISATGGVQLLRAGFVPSLCASHIGWPAWAASCDPMLHIECVRYWRVYFSPSLCPLSASSKVLRSGMLQVMRCKARRPQACSFKTRWPRS